MLRNMEAPQLSGRVGELEQLERLEQMKRMQEAQRSKVQEAPQQAVFDGMVNAFACEVERYENNVSRLVGVIEAPRPKNEPYDEKECMPGTVQEAFQMLYNKMVNNNEYLHDIISRLQEQVGELKILP